VGKVFEFVCWCVPLHCSCRTKWYFLCTLYAVLCVLCIMWQ